MPLVEHLCVLALACFALAAADETKTAGPTEATDLQRGNATDLQRGNATASPALLRLIYQTLSHDGRGAADDLNGGGEPERKKPPDNNEDAASRNRKEGCKFFYWKSWTAC